MAPVVTCRPVETGDGEAWYEIFESVAAEGRWIGAEAPISKDWFTKVVERYVHQPGRIALVAEVDVTPVGWITVEIVEGRTAELGMGVLKDHRALGVGTAMMGAAIDWARTHDVDHLTLDVFPDNEAAIGLYRKFGFSDVELKPGAWKRRNGDLWDLLAMERWLSP